MAAASTESCPETKISLPESDNEDDDRKRVQLFQRSQWLRAAILGANDGLLSTTSLMLGVGAAKDDNHSLMILTGVAGALAGACSMAVGEFVSVATQRDIQQAAVDQKNDDGGGGGGKPQDQSKKIDHESELAISSRIRERSVVSPATHDHTAFSPARSPFMKVVARDRCANETLEEEEEWLPNPYKAAGASGLAFLCGSLVPLLTAKVLTQETVRVVGIVIVASLALAVFGGAGARLGGSPVRVSAARVVVGGWIAMAITYGLLKPFDRSD